jgi:hypothetical protein
MKYDEETIILRDKIYIPAITIDERLVKKHYVHTMYDDKGCNRCEHRPERHCHVCDDCENYKGTFQTYSDVIRNGIQYFGIPIGDRTNVEKKLRIDLEDFEIIDKRVKCKFDYDIRCTLEMRDYQQQAIDLWKPYRHGMIVAPPRSGKTPLALHMAVKLGMRTLYVANQHEFLTQFLDHVEQYTNLPKLQDKYGVKLYGFAKKLEDYETLQIAVSTYQQFQDTAKGKERFNACKSHFGTLLIDEADKSAANVFARFLNKHPAKIKTGFTGTDVRKDCFVAGTPVVMADGTLKPVESVRPGMLVRSRNNTTGELENKPVVLNHVRKPSSDLIKVTHANGYFICTPDEEVWSVSRNCYVKAEDLTTFDTLLF